MAGSFFRRLLGIDKDDAPSPEAEERLAELVRMRDELQAAPPVAKRERVISMQIAFYSGERAAVEFATPAPNPQAQERLVMFYYAETLWRLGSSETAQQLYQYIAALTQNLVDKGALKRINILGESLELLPDLTSETPEALQQAILFHNADGSWEAEFSEPFLPAEFYLPSSMLLLFQHMLYALDEARVARFLMLLAAMHTFYETRHTYTEDEGHRLAPIQALLAVDQYLAE